MDILSRQLRLYRLYRMYAEWVIYLEQRVSSVLEERGTLTYAIAVLSLVQAEKKHVFSRFMSVEKLVLLAGLERLVSHQDDALSYLDSLYQQERKKALEKENHLLAFISTPHLWQARVLLLFVSQPSYGLEYWLLSI